MRGAQMTQSLNTQITAELATMQQAGTAKDFNFLASPMATEVQMEGRGTVLVLSSNNYLGLSDHPDVIQAGKDALDRYGAGTASVRFICGTFTIHRELEAALARLHQQEAALSYVSCWTANTGAIPALAQAEDVLISDALNHASLIDACRLSKAKRMIYPHSDMQVLEQCLVQAQQQKARRIFIVTDGVFSMEGDLVKLPEVVALARRYDASIILDDSHGVGVMGKTGRGTAEHFGLEREVDIITGTLGKALGGAAGGYVAASKAVIDYLAQVSRPQLFSNALPATVAASALKAVQILEAEPQRVATLHQQVARMRHGLQQRGFSPLEGESAIIPLIIGETAAAIQMSKALLAEGIFITGFGFPVVPEGTARLRIQISATLTDAQIDFALEKFTKIRESVSQTVKQSFIQ
jgi:glycine C-acetyltransferase